MRQRIGDSRCPGHRLQVQIHGHEHHRVLRIAKSEFGSLHIFARRAVIVDGAEIEGGLRQICAGIENIERSNYLGDAGKAGEAEGGQIHLLPGLRFFFFFLVFFFFPVVGWGSLWVRSLVCWGWPSQGH